MKRVNDDIFLTPAESREWERATTDERAATASRISREIAGNGAARLPLLDAGGELLAFVWPIGVSPAA